MMESCLYHGIGFLFVMVYLVKLVKLVCKKLIKGYSVSDILEEEEDVIKNIVDIAMKYAPEYDIDKICKEMYEINQNQD